MIETNDRSQDYNPIEINLFKNIYNLSGMLEKGDSCCCTHQYNFICKI